MTLKPLPKLILFALAVYALTGTYHFLVVAKRIPVPTPIQHIVALITPHPAPEAFPFSVAVAWILLLFFVVGLYLFKPEDEDEIQEYGPKVTVI